MRKKILSIALVLVMALGLTACSGGTKSKWSDEDFSFTDGSEKINVDKGYFIGIYEDYSFVENIADYSYDEYDKQFSTNRGLEVGMSVDEYKNLYTVMNGYAIWEILYSEGDEEWTTFETYSNQSPKELYENNTNSVWLDIGYYKDGSQWKSLTDEEVADIWFCDADMSKYNEIAILSVGFNDRGKIAGITFYHFDYNSAWAAFQDWQ